MRAAAQIAAAFSDREWRLQNLYQIIVEEKLCPWEANAEQLEFRATRHNRNFVAKGRKLGMSTEIVIENGDECVATPNMTCGIIDKSEEDAFAKLEIFRLAWKSGPDHPVKEIAWLWQRLHKSNPLTADSKGEMVWANGSRFRAGTSFTGRTPRRLHISEYGPICAEHPETAAKIQRGSINSVEPLGTIDIETTMEGGKAGLAYHYYDLAKRSAGRERSIADWWLHFFPWQGHPLYRLPGFKPRMGATLDYFRDIQSRYGLIFPDERMAWWESKRAELGDEIWCQYPTVVEEVEKAVVQGAIYPEMATVRSEGRIPERGFPIEKNLPLFTAWDLGSSEHTAGWLVQPAGKAHNLHDITCGEGEGAAGVAKVIRAWERLYGPIAIHFLPHDATIHDKGSGRSYVAHLMEAGINASTIRIVPRTPVVRLGIDEVRKRMPHLWFHPRCDEPMGEEGKKTPSGVQRLEGYRRKVDVGTKIAGDTIVKDNICDHVADALRTYCEADAANLVHGNLPRPAYNQYGQPNQSVQMQARTGFRR